MNYVELKVNVQDICEMTFTEEQLAMFTQQAEQKIYNTVQVPALRRNVTGTLTSGNKYLTDARGFLIRVLYCRGRLQWRVPLPPE